MVWTQCTANASMAQHDYLMQSLVKGYIVRYMYPIGIELNLDCLKLTILNAFCVNLTVSYCELDNCQRSNKSITISHRYNSDFLLPDLKLSTRYNISISMHLISNTTGSIRLFSEPITLITSSWQYFTLFVILSLCVVCVPVGYYGWRKVHSNMAVQIILPEGINDILYSKKTNQVNTSSRKRKFKFFYYLIK